MPDFFSIGDKSFFVIDYNLYSFMYDINYSLSDPILDEHRIDAYIKAYMEQAFLNERIEFCYSLCATSSGVEDYKKSDNYRNDEKIISLADRTDLQEAFVLLHEASHHLYHKYRNGIIISEGYQRIKELLVHTEAVIDDDFWEECYCDYKSITYVLRNTYYRKAIPDSEYLALLFRTLINTYTIQFFSICQNPSCRISVDTSIYDKQLSLYSLRFHNLYNAIRDYFQVNNQNNAIILLESVLEKSLLEFAIIDGELRQLSSHLEEEGVKKAIYFEDLDTKEKVSFIEDYLLIL